MRSTRASVARLEITPPAVTPLGHFDLGIVLRDADILLAAAIGFK